MLLRQQYYRYLLSPSKELLARELESLIKDREIIKLIINKNLSQIVKDLENILLPIIADYVHKQKKLSKTNIYLNLFSQQGEAIELTLVGFNANHYSLLFTVIRKFHLHVKEFIARLSSDYALVLELMNFEPDTHITFIDFGSGDDHNQGQKTCLIQLSNGKGFVYKPTNNHLDDILASIMQTYAEYPKQPKKMLHKRDSHGDYTYIELLPTNNNATTEAELVQFFYNYGELLAFGEFFCITDGHYENIVVNMPEVHWIDLETGINVKPNFKLEDTLLLQKLTPDNTKKGVINFLQRNNNFQIIVSKAIVYKDETDDMYLSYLEVLEDRSKTSHFFTLQSASVPINNYISYVQKGYEATSLKIIQNRSAILSTIQQAFSNNNAIKSRVILFNTLHYAHFITLLTNSHYPKHKAFKEILLKRRQFFDQQVTRTMATKIINLEKYDLINQTIPYFYRTLHSNSLFHISGMEVSNYFDNHLYDEILLRINNYNPDIASNKLFIQSALSSNITNNFEDFKQQLNWNYSNGSFVLESFVEE